MVKWQSADLRFVGLYVTSMKLRKALKNALNTTSTFDFQSLTWNENPNLHDNYAEPRHALQVPKSINGFFLQGVVIIGMMIISLN
jgi:hypothetical protein